MFIHALSLLPPSVKTVRLRSDTAGYQHELLSYCNRCKDERFGRIEFAIGADVTREFKKAVRETDEWHPIHDKKGRVTGQWAEVCFVPNAECTARKGQPHRYLAIRELVK